VSQASRSEVRSAQTIPSREVIWSVLLILALNVSSAILDPLLQAQTNSHVVEVPHSVAWLYLIVAAAYLISALVAYATQAKGSRVILLLLLTLTFLFWGYHFNALMCEGCLKSG